MPIPARTHVVVPCYNEADRLSPQAFMDSLQAHAGLNFVLVDSGSTDATAAILDRIAARHHRRAVPLHLPRNVGKAEAVRCGVREALALGARVVGYWDADLATPLEAIEPLAEELDSRQLDVVLGSRLKVLGKHIDRSLHRHLIGRAFATLASVSLNLPVYDTQCGAKLLRATPEVQSAFERPFALNWSFDVELVARLKHAYGPRFASLCAEYPLASWRDPGGSKLTAGQFPGVALEMLRLPAVVQAELRGTAVTG